jgi:phosphinothricin acetyltransferase
MAPRIRSATPADAAALLCIYAPLVEFTAISFELAPPTVEDFAARIEKAIANWAWLVAELNGQCVGYAYASLHRERPAYRWSVETSAYVATSARRQGLGALLYRQLFAALASRGYCNAFAGIALPNAASVALHQAVGFAPIGVFRAVGRKFGAWHDVAWYQKQLLEQPHRE